MLSLSPPYVYRTNLLREAERFRYLSNQVDAGIEQRLTFSREWSNLQHYCTGYADLIPNYIKTSATLMTDVTHSCPAADALPEQHASGSNPTVRPRWSHYQS